MMSSIMKINNLSNIPKRFSIRNSSKLSKTKDKASPNPRNNTSEKIYRTRIKAQIKYRIFMKTSSLSKHENNHTNRQF